MNANDETKQAMIEHWKATLALLQLPVLIEMENLARIAMRKHLPPCGYKHHCKDCDCGGVGGDR